MSEQANLTRRRFHGGCGRCGGVRPGPWPGRLRRRRQRWVEHSSGSGGGDGKITLTWWDYFNDANEKAVNQRIAAYKKAKPNVTIKRTGQPFADLKQKLLQGATAGELPDIVVIDNPDHSSFAALGVLADLTEQVKGGARRPSTSRARGSRPSTRTRTTASRTTRNCLALWSNTAMLEQAGVEVPTNWDDLRAAAKADVGTTRGIADERGQVRGGHLPVAAVPVGGRRRPRRARLRRRARRRCSSGSTSSRAARCRAASSTGTRPRCCSSSRTTARR